MNSSLLQIQSEIQENNILNLSFHSFEENSLFHYNDEESNNNIFLRMKFLMIIIYFKVK